MMPAPALSWVVIGPQSAAGFLVAGVPAFGSLFEVAPVWAERGFMPGPIRFEPMTDNAHIYTTVSTRVSGVILARLRLTC